MSFPPTWISSVNHVESYLRICSDAGAVRKLLGQYRLPPAYPRVTSGWILRHRFPAILLAWGACSFDDGDFYFTSENWRPPWFMRIGNFRINDLASNLSFRISRDEIVDVSDFQPSVVGAFQRYFTFKWTRIRTSQDGLRGDFLLGAGGYGPFMASIRQKNDVLRANVRAWCSAAPATSGNRGSV